MDQIIRAIAQKLGLPEAVVGKGVSILLGFFQKSNPTAYDKFASLIPGAAQAAEGAQTAAQEGNGLLGNLIGAAGNLLGGQIGSVAKLVGDLENAGIGAGQAGQFAQGFLDEAKNVAGTDIVRQLLAGIPAIAELSGEKRV